MRADIRPLHDRAIVRRLEQGDESQGGIIIPEMAQEKPQQGWVITVGDGRVLENGTRIRMSVEPGDRVLFGKYSGTEVEYDGQQYVILRDDEFLGVLEDS